MPLSEAYMLELLQLPSTTNDLNFWSRQYDRALAGEQLHFAYQRVVNGVEGWFDISLNPIYVNGGVTGVSIISRDITERMQRKPTDGRGCSSC